MGLVAHFLVVCGLFLCVLYFYFYYTGLIRLDQSGTWPVTFCCSLPGVPFAAAGESSHTDPAVEGAQLMQFLEFPILFFPISLSLQTEGVEYSRTNSTSNALYGTKKIWRQL